MTYNLRKGYIFFFFNTNLILYVSLIFTPLTRTNSYSQAAFLYWKVISFSLHNIRLDIFDLLTFYSRFYLLTERMPLKSWLPSLVECRFFKPINCALWPYYLPKFSAFSNLLSNSVFLPDIVWFVKQVPKIFKLYVGNFCSPPASGEIARDFLSSASVARNLDMIGALPNSAIRQVRVHWLMDLIKLVQWVFIMPFWYLTFSRKLVSFTTVRLTTRDFLNTVTFPLLRVSVFLFFYFIFLLHSDIFCLFCMLFFSSFFYLFYYYLLYLFYYVFFTVAFWIKTRKRECFVPLNTEFTLSKSASKFLFFIHAFTLVQNLITIWRLMTHERVS